MNLLGDHRDNENLSPQRQSVTRNRVLTDAFPTQQRALHAQQRTSAQQQPERNVQKSAIFDQIEFNLATTSEWCKA